MARSQEKYRDSVKMVSTVPESINGGLKRPGTGMMQLVLQEKERGRCFDSRAKVVCVCVFVCRAG